MADAERATCPRCGGLLPADDPPGLCPHCLLSDTQGDRTKMPPVSPSSSGPVNRKPALVSAGAAFVAILFGCLWLAGRREGQRADYVAHVDRGADLYKQRKVDEAIAAYRAAIGMRPELAEAHN